MSLFNKCRNFTAAREVQKAGYYPYFREISSPPGNEVIAEGKKVIMIGSNNYLGLTNHPKVLERIHQAVEKYGSGCTGSRFLNGTLDIHVELEEKLAEFMQTEAALVFSTGLMTNLGTISTIVGKSEYIFTDRADHASIVDGCRLSFGTTIKYKHNDMDDLQRVISKIPNDTGKLIVTDGVFSMEGDIVKLPRLVEIAKENSARILVDDAHSVGVLGDHGRGTAEHFGLENDVDITMGTFSKSFASIGGYIAGTEEVIHFIKHFSRPLIFSASPPPASVAAALASLEVLQEEPERRTRLWENTRRMHREFTDMGFDIGTSETPIIPIYIGEDMKTFQFWKELTDAGLFTNPVVPPAIQPNQCLIRTSYTATHTNDQLDRVLEIFHDKGKKFGII
ncbi:MAG: aminotransferase class I/II-fold pyridoxal phosphate-dependent enzyme [candidate division Zixibacteria bacterium]|nr:aminotransferase class I/II-fold pyridoxal phosphate-dependent enzyme [candidate division Zixibacteria bacterium]